MYFDMQALPADMRYKVLCSTVTPRPIAWVTTCSKAGIVNAAPYSFFNVMGHEPATLVLGLLRDPERGFKDTAENIMQTGEFVVNLVPEQMAQQMNITCMDAPRDISEIDCADLQTLPSQNIRPPRIAGVPVSFECQLLTSLVTGPQQSIVVGKVLAAHVGDEFIKDAAKAYIDTPALNLVGRMHGSGWYARTKDLFKMERQSYAQWLKSRTR